MASDEQTDIHETEESQEHDVTGDALLRNYITAMTDPTRGMILMELAHTGELTPTQLAKRLGLTANNVYHHMRVLRGLAVVDPPRAVARETYVEKYYRVTPELERLTGGDPFWLDRVQVDIAFRTRKSLMIGMYLTAAQMLIRASRRIEAMSDTLYQDLIETRHLGMISINHMSHERLARRLETLRDMLQSEHDADKSVGEEPKARMTDQDSFIMAALPLIWDDADDSGGE